MSPAVAQLGRLMRALADATIDDKVAWDVTGDLTFQTVHPSAADHALSIRRREQMMGVVDYEIEVLVNNRAVFTHITGDRVAAALFTAAQSKPLSVILDGLAEQLGIKL